MSKRLSENLSSLYLGAAQQLTPHKKRRKIVAYVESYDDILFWRTVLSDFENEERFFEVMLPSRTSLSKGKKIAIMNILGDRLGENMIACVDADYDYVMQGKTEISRIVNQNPFVFHTYVYAIENFQCYAPSLHNVCVMATLNDRKILDFIVFMDNYSEIIFPLFVWSVWCYRTGSSYKDFTLADFCTTVSFDGINLHHPDNTLEYVRRKVNRKINWLQHHFPQAKDAYADLKEELLRLGITPDSTYLYMRGHDLFDCIVTPMLSSVCDTLRREREREIRKLAEHNQQMQNELSCYQHSSSSIEEMLRKHSGFKEAAPYKKIQDDIRDFLKRLEKEPESPQQ